MTFDVYFFPMKRIKNETDSTVNLETIIFTSKCKFKKSNPPRKIFFFLLIVLILIFIDNNIFFLTFFKIDLYKNNKDYIFDKTPKKNNFTQIRESNIDLNDEFFKMREVQVKINKSTNLTYINTLSGGYGNIGNALKMLNNLIIICENIRCKNIVAPGGLQGIIKKPILYKKYNITILPSTYAKKIKIDISLSKHFIFWFSYKKQPHEMRLRIIREEVFNNIPKYKADPNDLYINIRSGDVFINIINRMYSQPPLCFYQKIINENKYGNIFILSNGHENPVVDRLLYLYPKIKYIHGTVLYDISVLVNIYNLVMPISTFPMVLIFLNNNLKNLYIYPLIKYILKKDINFTVHKMKPSQKYMKLMAKKWKKSKVQLDLMINEKCSNSSFKTFSNNNISFLYE